MSHRQRCAHVTERLQWHAAASQAEVSAVLEHAVAEGRARRIQSLWIANGVVFEATPEPSQVWSSYSQRLEPCPIGDLSTQSKDVGFSAE